jgi:hypothetical protein
MEQSPFLETDSHSDDELLTFYETRKFITMLITTLIQSTSSTSRSFKIHLNVILPSTPRSFKWYLPLSFSAIIFYAFIISHIHATLSAHLILLD